MKDIKAIYAKIAQQLDSRGPAGRPAHIILPHESALILAQWMEMQLELDAEDMTEASAR